MDASDNDASSARRVLIVDDNEDVTEMFSIMVASCGHIGRIANNGNEALALAQSFQPHVVLLDINLPDLDGFEVCARLRSMSACSGALIVAVTGSGAPHLRDRALACGFDLFYVKPVTVAAIRTVFESLTRRERGRRPQ